VGISGKQGTAVLIRNADGVVVRNNKFGPAAPTAPRDAKPLLIEVSRNVIVQDNQGISNDEQASPRQRTSFNADWRFHRGDPAEVRKGNPWISYFDKKDGEVDYAAIKGFLLATGNELTRKSPSERPTTNPGGKLSFLKPGFDDKEWRKLNLPHDWAIEGPFDIKATGHTGKLPYYGQAWYRKQFTLPASDAARRIFFEIDGAMAYSGVWVNGQMAGGWAYGYTSRSFKLALHAFWVAYVQREYER